MSAHTKTRRTDNAKSCQLRIPTAFVSRKIQDENITPWRELFRDLLEKQTEQGLYLSGLRCRESMTQKQLTDYLQVGQTQVSRMERGVRSISEEIALKLAELFKVPHQSFMTKANRLTE